MKKLLILSAALALCLGTAKADETSLRVTLRDGTTELYSLGEKPASLSPAATWKWRHRK